MSLTCRSSCQPPGHQFGISRNGTPPPPPPPTPCRRTPLGCSFSVYSVNACWRLELGQDTPHRYLTWAGKPVTGLVYDPYIGNRYW